MSDTEDNLDIVFKTKQKKHRDIVRNKQVNSDLKDRRDRYSRKKDISSSIFTNNGVMINESENQILNQTNQPSQAQKQSTNQQNPWQMIENIEFDGWFSKDLFNCVRYFAQQLQKSETQKQEFIDFLKIVGLLSKPICSGCKQELHLGKLKDSEYGHVWRCSKCNNRKITFSKAYPDICSKTHLTLPQLLLLLLYYLPHQISSGVIQKALNIGEKQVTTAKKLWQSIIKHYYSSQYSEQMIGGKGKVVEVDESSFQRKYQKGRILKRSQWVLGLTERGGGFQSTILIPVDQRNAETLIPIIEMYVDKQTKMIVSDCWRGYLQLSSLGYCHKQVNHSKQFVVPLQNEKQTKNNRKKASRNNKNKTNNNKKNNNQRKSFNQKERKYLKFRGEPIHTQTIENRWNHIKGRLKRLKGKRLNYLVDIQECLFYLSYQNEIEMKALAVLIDFLKDKLSYQI